MSRTGPFFLPQKEIDVIDSMNEELIDEIVGQSVDIIRSVSKTRMKMYMVNRLQNIMRLVLELIV